MTTGTPEQTLEWMRDGTKRLLAELGNLSDDDLKAPSLLPGWDRRYLLSHVASNADALRNLVHWARTGEECRMYASVEARDAGIKAGAAKPASELRAWVGSSAAALEIDLDGLSGDHWDAKVITVQGLTREAREIPWMRVREVYIHAVDLGGSAGFADLPAGFLTALLDDVVKRRSTVGETPALAVTASDADGRTWEVQGPGETTSVTGPLADIAAWLSGRPVTGLTTADGQPLPDLPAWL